MFFIISKIKLIAIFIVLGINLEYYLLFSSLLLIIENMKTYLSSICIKIICQD